MFSMKMMDKAGAKASGHKMPPKKLTAPATNQGKGPKTTSSKVHKRGVK